MSIWLHTALAAASASMAVAAPPEVETFVRTIEKGDSCEKLARELYGDETHIDVIHRYNPWLGAQLPHHLEPGQTLVLPKTLPPPLPDAEVTVARRNVEARAPEASDWSSARPGLDLWRGWRVNTREQSSAQITFRDQSRVEMRENTLVIIYGGLGGSRGKARRETAEATLDRGALRSRLGAYTGKGDHAVTVTTPSAVAEFAGGASLVTVDDAGTSRVANHGEGRAAVRSASAKGPKGPKVRIAAKMGSRVDTGKAPSKPKPLPPTPAWIERGPATFVAVGELGGTIEAEWGAIAGAASYRVEVSQDSEGSELLTSQVVPSSIHRFEAHGLPAGDYYASVAAVDGDAFESPPSERLPLTVVPVGLVTPGAAPLPTPAPAADGTTVGMQGTTVGMQGPTRVLRGTKLDVPSGLRCRVDDGVPSRAPVLADAGEHAIACMTDDSTPVPGFAVVVIEPKLAAEAEAHTAVRGETTEVAFSIDAEVPLPRRLWLEAPEGLMAATPVATATAGHWRARVHADAGAPADASLRVMADAGGEPVELGQIALTVDDPPAAAPVPAPETAPRRRELHMVEGGLYGGVMLPSPRHNLFQVSLGEGLAWERLAPAAASFGMRLGYYPIRWVGAELEQGLAPTRTRETDQRVNLFTVRAHVIGQLPWRLTPTVHVGAGAIGITKDSALGGEVDTVIYFGVGAKLYVTRWVVVRLDVRDAITEARGLGVAHSPEILLGVAAVLGRRSAAAPERRRRTDAARKRDRSATREPAASP